MSKSLYLFMGAPGSGKGSVAQLCSQEFGWKQLSTGNLCRKHIAEQTEIGKEIDFTIKSGKLVSNELITAMVVDALENDAADAEAVILDGYPRTVEQARALDQLIRSKHPEWTLTIIHLIVSDDTVVDRLSRRFICFNNECQAVYSLDPSTDREAVCESCAGKLCRRKDDEPEAIRERLAIYHKHEGVLLDFYRELGQEIKEVSVEQPLSRVFEDFKATVGISAL